LNDDYYECLTPESTIALLEACKAGNPPKMGKWGSLPMNGQVSLCIVYYVVCARNVLHAHAISCVVLSVCSLCAFSCAALIFEHHLMFIFVCVYVLVLIINQVSCEGPLGKTSLKEAPPGPGAHFRKDELTPKVG
jgi:hypothetical protein